MKTLAFTLSVLWIVAFSTVDVRAAKFIGLGQPFVGYDAGPDFGWLGQQFVAVPSGVSADGQVIAGNVFMSSRPSNRLPDYPVMWTPESGWALLLGGDDPRPPFELKGSTRAVSADGSVIIGALFNGYAQVWDQVWTTESGWNALASLPADEELTVWGISAGGTVMVGHHSTRHGDPIPGPLSEVNGAISSVPYRWTIETGVVDLTEGDGLGHAVDVSADGSIVVGNWRSEPFRWSTESGMVGLGRLHDEDAKSWAREVSADGSVVVGVSGSDSREVFRWSEETGMLGLGISADTSGYLGVSQDGSIIVFSHSDQPFIWDTDNGTRNFQEVLFTDFGLDLPGWTLTEVSALSDDGTIFVGLGINPNGVYESWMVVIPEPSSGVLALLGLLGLVAWTKTRRSMLTCLGDD